ncbi:MAG: hypothetical protein KBT67_06300 [bacterium]|nr:hypothetical protein [Candidatus Limimorpha caballi]
MEEENKKEEIQNRREFLKKTAKSALPILGISLFGPAILESCSKDKDNDSGSGSGGGCNGCSGGCSSSCSGSCDDSCSGNCDGCTGSCFTTACSGM